MWLIQPLVFYKLQPQARDSLKSCPADKTKSVISHDVSTSIRAKDCVGYFVRIYFTRPGAASLSNTSLDCFSCFEDSTMMSVRSLM